MSLELNEVDQAIEVALKEASAVETFARRLEERISRIPGARQLLPRRKYGQPVDTKAIRANLSLSSLIMQDSAELSHYLGLDPSVKRRIDEEREAKAMAPKHCRCAQSASERPTNVLQRLASSSSSVASTQLQEGISDACSTAPCSRLALLPTRRQQTTSRSAANPAR